MESTLNTSTSNTSSSSHNTKKETLHFLKPSLYIRARNSLFQSFAYLYSVYPISPLLIKFGSVVILLQIYLPSFLVGLDEIYPNKDSSLIYKVAQVLSFFIYFFPHGTAFEVAENFAYIYIIVNLISIVCIMISANNFSHTSTIHPILIKINYYIATTKKLFLTPAAGSTAALIINSEDLSNYRICLFSFILFFYFLSVLADLSTERYSLFFVPYSLSTYSQRSQSIILIFLGLLSFVSASVTFSKGKNKYISFGIILALYTFLYIYFMFFGFVLKKAERIALNATNLGSILNLLAIMVIFLFKHEVPLFFPLVSVAIWGVLFILHYIIAKKVIIRSLKAIDLFQQDLNSFKKCSSLKITQIIIHGFGASHEYCLTYNIFRDLVETFPENAKYLFCYAKFLAIFPDESVQMNWVMSRLKRLSTTRKVNKYGITQIKTLLMRRDTHLSKELRHKIRSVGNLVETSRLRLRNTWESLISGTFSDIEISIEKVMNTITEIEDKFTNMQNYHCNNQYSLRAQALFLRDVVSDYERFDFLVSQIKMLQTGRLEEADQPFLYGHFFFPNLPARIAKKPIFTDTNPQTLTNTISSDSFAFLKEDSKYNSDIRRSMYSILKNSIFNLRVTSVYITMSYHTLVFIFLGIVPLIICSYHFGTFENALSLPSNTLTFISFLRDSFSAFTSLSFRLYFETFEGLDDQCFFNDDQHLNLSGFENIGGSCRSNDQLLYFGARILMGINKLNDIIKSEINDKDFLNAKNILFNKKYDFTIIRDVNDKDTYFKESITLQQYLVGLSVTGNKFGDLSPDDENDFFPFFGSLLLNYYQTNTLINEAADDMLKFILNQSHSIERFLTIFEFFFCVSIVIVHMVISVYSCTVVRGTKRKVYGCYHALPKNVLQKMISKIDTSIGHFSNTTGTLNTSRRNPSINGNRNPDETVAAQVEEGYIEYDEVRMKLLHTMSILRSCERGQNTLNSRMYIVLAMISIAFFTFSFVFCSFHLKSTTIAFSELAPHENLVSVSFSDAVQALTYMNTYVMYNSLFLQIGVDKDNAPKLYEKYRTSSLINYADFFYENSSDAFTEFYYRYDIQKKEEDYIKSNVTDYHVFYNNIPMFSLYYLMMELLEIVYTERDTNRGTLQFDLSEIWHIQIVHYFSDFVDPLLASFFKEISEMVSSKREPIFVVLSVVLIIEAFLNLWTIKLLKSAISRIRLSLLLLLHAPPDAILSSKYISSILAGNFNHLQNAKHVHFDENIFDNSMEYFPEGIIQVDKSGRILRMNRTASRFFGRELKSELPFKFSREKNSTDNVEYKEKNFKVTTVKVDNEASSFFLVLKDITESTKTKIELRNEKQKMTELIQKLIPFHYVQLYRWQKPISFSIPSTTIMSISIQTDFKNIADVYSEMLTKINEVSSQKFPNLSPVEVIVDRLFVFGGLFDRDSSPNSIACEIIDLGICVLEIASMMDVDVLIGIASGGPMIAGVIRTGRPHFEFIGDICDFVNGICTCGFINTIHFPRSTYELIYGRNYEIKERNQHNIPTAGNVVTYTIQL